MADQLTAVSGLSDPGVISEMLVEWRGEVGPPGGWRRIAWNFCWRFGANRDFPLSADATTELIWWLRDELVKREAPSRKVDALVAWSLDKYHSHRQTQIHQAQNLGPEPFRPRPFYVVEDLPLLMRQPNDRGEYRPLVQYAKDWGARPLDRHLMMADPPPEGTEAQIAVSIATVVHALCDLDEIIPPDWVFGYRYAHPMRVWGKQRTMVNNANTRRLVETAPPACHFHNLYFGYSFIEGYLWLKPPPKLRTVPSDQTELSLATA